MSVRSAKTVKNACRRLKTLALGLLHAMTAMPGLVVVLGLMSHGSVSAQTTEGNSKPGLAESRIRIAIPSLVEVENKLKWLIELSPDPQLRKQWKKLKQDLIDAFTDGIDEERPIVVDAVFSSTGLTYDLRIPISDLTDERTGFLSGLRGRSYIVRKLPDGTYEILGEDEQVAHLLVEQDYAWIATRNRPVSARPPSATADLASILDLKKDIVVELETHLEDMRPRRAGFEAFREYVERGHRKRRNETQKAFELRKSLSKHFLAAAEEFIVEAANLQVTWNLDTSGASGVGRGEVSLTALPGTNLAKLIDEAGTRSWYFSNLTPHDNVLAAANISVVLDDVRSRQFKELGQTLRPIFENEIETRLPKIERDAWTRAVSLFFKMTEEAADLGTMDGFAELFGPAANKHVLICGLRVANGKQADEIIKLVPSFRTDWKVRLNAREHAGVGIHEMTVGKQDLASFQCVFANENTLYVGTSQSTVWIAAGNGALDQLKRSIDQAGRPSDKANPVLFRYQIHVGRLASLIDSLQKRDSPQKMALSQDDRQLRKDIDKYIKLIHDATTTCDSTFSGELRRSGNSIKGFTELNECVLKCVGSILASTLKDLE